MATINIELSGGPLDGQQVSTDEDPLPRAIVGGWAPLGSAEREKLGYYVQSRKITRKGRLIYEFRYGDISSAWSA